MHGTDATVASGPVSDACSEPHPGDGLTAGGGAPPPVPNEPGALERVRAVAVEDVAAEELAAAAIRMAAAATAAARRARIGWRMGVLPVGYPGEEGIWSI